MLSGFYINLSHRKDRKDKFEELKNNYPLFSQIKRFNAIQNVNGAFGCTMSHKNALQEIYNNIKQPYYIICEDDFFIFNKKNYEAFNKKFEEICDLSWNVITLTPRGDTLKEYTQFQDKDFFRVVNNQTMTAYIIKREFVPILIDELEKGIQNMMDGKGVETNTCDQIWKNLQHNNIFLYYKNIFAGQLPGDSDIEKREVNYNKRFVTQNRY